MAFVPIPEAVDELRDGRIIVVVDDEDRENEGDLTIAAESVTPEIINFMATYGRGLICVALTGERLDHLQIPLMTSRNTALMGTAFCEMVDAADGVTTGISAADRACTIQAIIDPATRPSDLVRPGHVPPLRASKGGVLVRAGQTEAAVDLTRLAGMIPAGVICEVMNEDGTMARVPQLIDFCAEHGLKMVTVADLIRYRLENERYVQRFAEGAIDTPYGEFHTIAYRSEIDGEVHIALVKGKVDGEESVLVRMHAKNAMGDIFSSSDYPSQRVIAHCMERIADEGQRRTRLSAPHRAWVRFGIGARRRETHCRAPEARDVGRRGGPTAHATRVRHRRANPLRPRIAYHPPAHELAPQGCCSRRFRDSDPRADPGLHREISPHRRPLRACGVLIRFQFRPPIRDSCDTSRSSVASLLQVRP